MNKEEGLPDPGISSAFSGVVLTRTDFDWLRELGLRHPNPWLVGRWGAEQHRFANLETHGYVKKLSIRHLLAPGYELTRKGVDWLAADASERPDLPRDADNSPGETDEPRR